MIARLAILLLAFAAISPRFAAELPVTIPPPPIPPSPIEDFRRWLTMDSNNREKELASYPEEKRTILRRKIENYQAMRPADRDHRLQLLELRWYLQPLMASTNRGNHLDVIPPRLHEAINVRLKHWDNLAASTREEILADQKKREMATRYYVLPRRTQVVAAPFPTNSAHVPAELQVHFKRWENKSPSARARISSHVVNFFQMPKDDQLEALNAFSEQERREMQRTLDVFAQLSPEARRVCVASFQKFASMPRDERASFLRNATRWQQLTPQERAVWRDLVEKVPPLPPIQLPPPPMPGTPVSVSQSSNVAESGLNTPAAD